MGLFDLTCFYKRGFPPPKVFPLPKAQRNRGKPQEEAFPERTAEAL